MTTNETNNATRRGDLTRERLLDAVENWVAEAGFDAPTHRGIGERAQVHTALVNYHFGSKEVLLDDMVARRAPRLVQAWQDALRAVREQPGFGPEDVLRAYWKPFEALGEDPAGSWQRYLCVVAHLFRSRRLVSNRQKHFGVVEREFHRALYDALPGLTADEVQASFMYARELIDEVLLHHCQMNDGQNAPAGFRSGDVDRLIAFLAAGMKALSVAHPERGMAEAAAD